MRIGEAAQRAGVNVETLRYYERRGLLPEPDRGIGGHREYGEETVRFVSAVKQAQALGFSLGEIEDFVRLARRDPAGAPELVRRRLEEKLGQVEGEIAD
jgi:DNA-binding transcriptional MerR regulator